MARCGCTGASCSCIITGAGGVSVSGAGSPANPYVVSSDINMQVTDTATVDMSLTGNGSSTEPYSLSASATLELDELLDVDTTGATTGQVLARQADGTYKFAPATTAPTGAINVSNGIAGDGTAGNPLNVKLAPSSGLVVDATGLRTQGGGAWTTFTPVWYGATTDPELGNGTIAGAYSQIGKTVHISIDLRIGSTTKRGVGGWGFNLPVAPIASRYQSLSVILAAVGVPATYTGSARVNNGKIDRILINTSNAAQDVSHSVPSSMQSGSYIIISGTYEAA